MVMYLAQLIRKWKCSGSNFGLETDHTFPSLSRQMLGQVLASGRNYLALELLERNRLQQSPTRRYAFFG
jgi:hypothetical protein